MAPPLDVAEYIDRYPWGEDCHWVTEHFSFKTLPAIVERVHFCAANNERNEVMVKGAEPVNHWMIFLQTGAKTSVRVSISSGENSTDPGLIGLMSLPYIVSHYSPRVVSSNIIVPGLTVERVFRMLIENGRDRYKFTDQHVGCRYWCCCVADDFERQGWVARGLAERVYQEASWYYPDIKNTRDSFRAHSPIVAASFFWYAPRRVETDCALMQYDRLNMFVAIFTYHALTTVLSMFLALRYITVSTLQYP